MEECETALPDDDLLNPSMLLEAYQQFSPAHSWAKPDGDWRHKAAAAALSLQKGSGYLVTDVYILEVWRTVGSEYMAMPQVYATFCPVRDTDPDITL